MTPFNAAGTGLKHRLYHQSQSNLYVNVVLRHIDSEKTNSDFQVKSADSVRVFTLIIVRSGAPLFSFFLNLTASLITESNWTVRSCARVFTGRIWLESNEPKHQLTAPLACAGTAASRFLASSSS